MCTNFDFLKSKDIFKDFANQAIEAEKSLLVSPATSAILSRRAVELAVKWLYSFDNDLRIPYQDNISTLVHEQTFRDIIEPKLFPLIKYIIKLGNTAVHTNSMITRDEAILSLRNLHEVVRWMEYCYADDCTSQDFDETILVTSEGKRTRPQELQNLYERLSCKDKRLEEVRKENEELRELMTKLRKESIEQYDFKVDEISESETRRRYIDIELKLAGWEFGKDCRVEVEVQGMPNPTGIGSADYVLYGANGKPLAVVEAKKTSVKPEKGSHQAKLYADCLHNQYNQRPLIFITNGFEIHFIDDTEGYPKRPVQGIFTQDELQRMVDRRTSKKPFENVVINDDITNRYYQKQAIMDICKAIENKQRKFLAVMATGSGKTRVAISLVDVLTRHNHVKNVLFLADRTALVSQAKKSFSSLLPSLTISNLIDKKQETPPEQARMIFSTYPTMMNAIDEAKRKDGKKLFTPAHFDLIIVDESHRSIYKKYQDIFDYFDGMLLGLTATPKDSIDTNTYTIFELETGAPTFAYELEKAVTDKYLVYYNKPIEIKTKLMEQGIHYDELSDDEKEHFEETFAEDEKITDSVDSAAVNEWLFNDNTIDLVLNQLMDNGLKVESGDKLGKTIIFAKNSNHAKAIVERFNKVFPSYGPHFMKQIDYSIKYVDSLIDDFKTKDKFPQVAVSVDMLDTGIDIPEILNLVFFKKVRSKAKFWQMIGRGTRLCPNLLGPGIDKQAFQIFDFCNNFEFFRANNKGMESKIQPSLTEKIFNTKLDLVRELQALQYQEDDYIAYREALLSDLLEGVQSLNEESFRVKMHKQYVDIYKNKEAWNNLGATTAADIKKHITPIINPLPGSEESKRFDLLVYTVDLAYLQKRDAPQHINGIRKTAEQLSCLGTIPQVLEHKYLLEKVQTDEFWQQTDVLELEEVRLVLRELIKFIEKTVQPIYTTHFNDMITGIAEGEIIYDSNDLKNYRKKVEYYLQEHRDELAVFKLRNNKKLTSEDLKTLERIMWEELGSKDDYEKEFGTTPVSKLVRKLVGLDREAANVAFSKFISDQNLNTLQIRFIELIIDYVVTNGMIESNQVFMEDPFRGVGAIIDVFEDRLDKAKEILDVVNEITRNCEQIIS